MTNPFAYPDAPANTAGSAPMTTPAPLVNTAGSATLAGGPNPFPQPAVHPDYVAATAGAAPPSPAGEDPFAGPAAQAPRGPRVRDVYGRLLLITPHLVETVANRLDKANPGATQQRMTADVVILDGGPCPYGGEPEKINGKPHDKVAQIPHRTVRQFISNVGLVSQCREALEKRRQGQPGMVLGRLGAGVAKSNDVNPPYLLTPPTDADNALARAYLATVDPFA